MAANDHPHIALEPYPEADERQEANWGSKPVRFKIRCLREGLNNTFYLHEGNYMGTELLKELHLAIGEELAKRAHAQR